MELLRLRGQEARAYVHELAALRLKVFFDFPYLYEGTFEYEKKYLETYFKADDSFILLVKENDKIVGATTGIRAIEEEESFRKPFTDFGLDVSKTFYFGESILLPEYRGRGLGKTFFEERENFARSLGNVSTLAFCGVVRADTHALKPKDYRPLDLLWQNMGFKKEPELTTTYEWLDRGEASPTKKKMQFWLKHL